MGEPRPVFVLTLEALPDQVPPANRLRAVLKLLARYRFRCRGARELPAADHAGGPGTRIPGPAAEPDQSPAPEPEPRGGRP